MRTAQKIAVGGLGVALAAATFEIFELGQPSTVAAKKKAAAAQTALVDETPLKTAQQLTQLADTPEEQALAKDVLRLSDYELDLSFNIALQDAEAHPPDLSADAKEIQGRLQKAQKLQQALQTQVDQLTAETAKASGDKKDALQDQLDLAKAGLADKARAAAEQKFPAEAPEQLGLVHRVQRWMALNEKKKLLQRGKTDADNLEASLTEQHNALSAQIDAEKFNSPDLAAHSKLSDTTNGAAPVEAAANSVTQSVRKARSSVDAKAVLATTKAITADQRNLTSLDKRVSYRFGNCAGRTLFQYVAGKIAGQDAPGPAAGTDA